LAPGRLVLGRLVLGRLVLGRLAHGMENLCTAENWFAAQTKRTTRKTKLER
jgi:hypothetical protein